MAKTRGQKGLVERRLEEEHRVRTLGGRDTKEKPGGSSQALDTANQVRGRWHEQVGGNEGSEKTDFEDRDVETCR